MEQVAGGLDAKALPPPNRPTIARPHRCCMPEEHPIAFTALQPVTAQMTDGHDCGAAQEVLVDEKVSVCDGFVVQTTQGTRFVDAASDGRQ